MEIQAEVLFEQPKSVTSDFPNVFHPWMAMTYGQFDRTKEWLHNQILLDTVRKTQHAKKFEIGGEPAVHGEFSGVRQVMWRHRCVGVIGYASLLVEYEICEVGNPEAPLITGKLKFWHSC